MATKPERSPETVAAPFKSDPRKIARGGGLGIIIPTEGVRDTPAGMLVGYIPSAAEAAMTNRANELSRTIGDPPDLHPERKN